MRYDEAAILTDLDGTLFDSQGQVSPEDRAAIRAFVQGGGLFGVATGREPHNARLHLPDLPLSGPSIVLNGAAIYDFEEERYLSTVFIDREAAEAVVAHCLRQELPLDIQVYTTEGIFYVTPLESAHPGFLRIHQPTRYVPVEQLREQGWFKVVLLERQPEALAPMRAYLAEEGLDRRLNLVEGTTDAVKDGKQQELLPKDVTKGTGMAMLRKLPIYRGRRLFAVGDYWNDLELLQAADVPCAPENAIPEIRELSRHVLPSHNHSPMAALIQQVIPREG